MIRLSRFLYSNVSLVVVLAATAVSFGYLFFVQIGAAECFETAGEGAQSLGTSFGLSEGARCGSHRFSR